MRYLPLAALLVLSACGRPAPPVPPQAKVVSDPAAPSTAVEPAQAEMDAFWIGVIRRGGAQHYLVANHQQVEAMLSRKFTRGKTTKAEVFEVFGNPSLKNMGEFHSLDRPKRDGVEAYQYNLFYGDLANWDVVYMDFDAKNQVLLDWGTAGAVCGYCPHVFSFDGTWRLEGKMLAGRVGIANRGLDTMVLPRLVANHEEYLVKLENLAPEIEFLSRAELTAVPLDADEELDLLPNGDPIVWRPDREVPIQMEESGETWIPSAPGRNFLVLELRNTSAFEEEMRRHFVRGKTVERETKLTVDFGGSSVCVDPVGTKFLRRVAVEIPQGSELVKLQCDAMFWYCRRIWFGRMRDVQPEIVWSRPDGDRSLQLSSGDEIVLHFPSRIHESERGKLCYALRLEGYYEFLPTGPK